MYDLYIKTSGQQLNKRQRTSPHKEEVYLIKPIPFTQLL